MDPKKIAQMTIPAGLRSLMANARRLGREDVYWNAFRRLSELEGLDLSDPLERDFYRVLNAYEQLLTEKNGRTMKASRTRQKMMNKGVMQCLIDWAVGNPTEGFRLLVDKGQPELTAEYLVTKYKDRFDDDVVESARARLVEHGAGLPPD